MTTEVYMKKSKNIMSLESLEKKICRRDNMDESMIVATAESESRNQ